MKKTKKRSNSPLPFVPRHPYLRARHPSQWRATLAIALVLAWLMPAPVPADGAQKKSKAEKFAETFLIYATVFDRAGMLVPGAHARALREGDRKPRWEAYSDARGEFALRVPKGAKYKVMVTLKGYAPETQEVDAGAGDRADIVVHLTPAKGKKP